jgi:hypothetical protein
MGRGDTEARGEHLLPAPLAESRRISATWAAVSFTDGKLDTAPSAASTPHSARRPKTCTCGRWRSSAGASRDDGRAAVSPGPAYGGWTPRRRPPVSMSHPHPAAADGGASSTPRAPCANRRAEIGIVGQELDQGRGPGHGNRRRSALGCPLRDEEPRDDAAQARRSPDSWGWRDALLARRARKRRRIG